MMYSERGLVLSRRRSIMPRHANQTGFRWQRVQRCHNGAISPGPLFPSHGVGISHLPGKAPPPLRHQAAHLIAEHAFLQDQDARKRLMALMFERAVRGAGRAA